MSRSRNSCRGCKPNYHTGHYNHDIKHKNRKIYAWQKCGDCDMVLRNKSKSRQSLKNNMYQFSKLSSEQLLSEIY